MVTQKPLAGRFIQTEQCENESSQVNHSILMVVQKTSDFLKDLTKHSMVLRHGLLWRRPAIYNFCLAVGPESSEN